MTCHSRSEKVPGHAGRGLGGQLRSKRGSQDLWAPDCISPAVLDSIRLVCQPLSSSWVIPGAHMVFLTVGTQQQLSGTAGPFTLDGPHCPAALLAFPPPPAVLLACFSCFSRELNCFFRRQGGPKPWQAGHYNCPALAAAPQRHWLGIKLDPVAVQEGPVELYRRYHAPCPRNQPPNYLHALILQGQSFTTAFF